MTRPRSTSSSHNRSWTADDIETLRGLLVGGDTLATIAAKLGRTYAAVEKRVWKLGKAGAAEPVADQPFQTEYRRPLPPDVTTTNLTCHAIDQSALPIIHELYARVSAHRAATVAKTYTYQAMRPRVERVIAAIVRDLVLLRFGPGTTGWIKVCPRQARSSSIGVSVDVVRNLLEALAANGFIERVNGYEKFMGRESAALARAGRATRIRGTTKLFELCAKHNLTRGNVEAWFTAAATSARSDSGS